MIRLEGPYGTVQRISILPNPRFADEESIDATTSLRRAMDNTVYTYNKRPDTLEKVVTFTFAGVGRGKMLEVIEFIELYTGGFIRLIDHKTPPRVWKAILETNPADFTTASRSFPCGGGKIKPSVSRDEVGDFTLRFIGLVVGTE